MDKQQTNRGENDVHNRLLHKEDFLHQSKHPTNSFTETETNIVLIIILFVIILLFWVPIAEVVR